MKKISQVSVLLLIFILVMPLLSCGTENTPEYTNGSGEPEYTLYICSDLHLLADSVISGTTDKGSLTSDGRMQAYDYALVQAMIDIVNRDKPDALILTGDLSFNGEKESHEELVRLLDTIDKSVRVLVIPGNHDTYILNGMVADCSTTYESFRVLYSEYGYTNALSYDETTLSYAYALGDDLVALMLDTTLNRYNEEENRNVTGGALDYDTVQWMESVLSAASEQGQRVICFSHHNLLDHNTGFTAGYTLIDHEEIVSLLMQYGVQLNFSGHLHIQSIASFTENSQTFYDIASSSLLVYDNTIGVLDLYDDGFIYKKESAAPYDGFTVLSKEHFTDVYYAKSISSYTSKYGDDADAVLKFSALCNALYFAGDYETIASEKKANRQLVRIIEKVSGSLPRSMSSGETSQKYLSGFWN